MKATVTTLYRRGRRCLSGSKIVTGDLNLSVGKHPVTGLVSVEACVLDEDGLTLVPPMIDAVCVCIAANGMRLRGVECVAGREVAQEWWCRFGGEK